MIKAKEKSLDELLSDILADSHSVMEAPSIRPFDNPELLPEANDFTMSSGITKTPEGKLWISWFGGEDGERAYLLMASSEDDGRTWSPPQYIIKEPPTEHGFYRSILGGNLWTDPQGRMWCFFTYNLGYFDGRGGCWCSVCENPNANELTWSTPKRISDGFTLNKPIIMKNNEWLLPTSLWPRSFMFMKAEEFIEFLADRKNAKPRLAETELYSELDNIRMANFIVSDDKGATWKRRGGVYDEHRQYDEPVLFETLNDELICLLRTKDGISETASIDFARTWTSPVPSTLKHCTSRIFTSRLKSGKLLLVKHGPLYEKTGRSHLTAYLSDNDGARWYGGLILDERDNVSYPDGFQSENGEIYITYDRKRIDGEILLAVFTENDVKEGKIVSPSTRLKITVQCSAAQKKHGSCLYVRKSNE